MLSNDELWNKCGTGQRITYDDIGLDPSKHINGTQTYAESELASDIDIFREISGIFVIIISATITLGIVFRVL